MTTDTKRLRELHVMLMPHEHDELRSLILAACEELEAPKEYPSEDIKKLVRELDVIWNGEEGAAKQASLCDIVGQLKQEVPRLRTENEKLRAALDQANRAAEEIAQHKDRGVVTPEQFKLIYRMRANRKSLLGSPPPIPTKDPDHG